MRQETERALEGVTYKARSCSSFEPLSTAWYFRLSRRPLKQPTSAGAQPLLQSPAAWDRTVRLL
jgi:hypothetical protein